ncbi:hypothetical protein FK531_20425 [Rhodococcus spelaei]|uniref:Uncharacterized protein n=1 Tax=Rhodococcus spelaei TaxID=2546320 RepID=A0A541B0F8_9NOCA|nr:hypothetical protein [Rhodococcus spelaei]TQF65794.1 hypothetical protein FK531_20425 [Rhodococcus spelaei]
MTETRNSPFGAASYASTTVTLLALVGLVMMPTTDSPTPAWMWLAIVLGFVAWILCLARGGTGRRVAVGILVGVLTPILLLLTIPVVAVVGKVVGAIVG